MKEESYGRGLIRFGTIVTNLKDDRLTRYIRIDVVLSVDNDKKAVIANAIMEKKVVMKDWLISHLNDQSVKDVTGKNKQTQLRKDVQAGFNKLLFPAVKDGDIKAVLFEDFAVQ